MVTQNTYDPIKQTFFYLRPGNLGTFNIKVNPDVAMNTALNGIQKVFGQYSKDEPFEYQFSDQEYARKFSVEERVGRLATCFSVLAIFISCLGLFGMASFMAEQRIKEIAIRKVLGASVFKLWSLLSLEFVGLVSLSLLIGGPVAWWFMHSWLDNYPYRTDLSWWIFAAAALGTMGITLVTVSYQTIKAAVANPVKSLRSE
jgi:ABC-type antimicrobial peptide transport system permease subunit